MKRIFAAYRDLISIICAEAPLMVIITFVLTALSGVLTPFSVYVNQRVFDGGLAVARSEMAFSQYSIYLFLFVFVSVLPGIIGSVIYGYVEPRSLLILRTAYRARMLEKLKTMKYEHFENEQSVEIINKAFFRAENSARHMWPMYVYWRGLCLIASIGSLAYLFNVRWWLPITVLIPFALETYIATKVNYNIYTEMEKYWNKERRYSILGSYLRSRNFTKELKSYGNYDYLIDTYTKRLNERNRDYEHYYFKNLRQILLSGNITKAGEIVNLIIILVLFATGKITVGLFIALSKLVFMEIYGYLGSIADFFKWSGYHINSFEYYDKFFQLSDDPAGTETDLPSSFDIEFRDVWFKYPGTDRYVLKGLNLKIEEGEKASIVGENGEGKSTMIKLLLGLFTPDKGEILIGEKNLNDYPLSLRTKIFGPVFQDFPRYSITIGENIGIGDIDEVDNVAKIKEAAEKAEVAEFAEKYPDSYNTLLGRDFEGGVDLSGGQWQRIAIARALMGDKPVLLLDEPTSQLDPIAEAELYREFATMVKDRTAILVTHRLGSTMITDRIFVINDGQVAEMGTHSELMQKGGIYAEMFNAQKQWYRLSGKEAV